MVQSKYVRGQYLSGNGAETDETLGILAHAVGDVVVEIASYTERIFWLRLHQI